MKKLTRKWIEENSENNTYISMEEFNNYNPKDLQFKEVARYRNGVILGHFQFKTASKIDGTYWASILIKE